MGLFGERRSKQNIAKFSAECHSMDCSGDNKVLDDEKSRELKRI